MVTSERTDLWVLLCDYFNSVNTETRAVQNFPDDSKSENYPII